MSGQMVLPCVSRESPISREVWVANVLCGYAVRQHYAWTTSCLNAKWTAPSRVADGVVWSISVHNEIAERESKI